MIVGYNLSGSYNDSYMFDEDDPNLPLCPKCGYITNFGYISPLFKLNRCHYDVSATYDIRFIVSLKFKEFCIRHRYQGLVFRNLPNLDTFFKLEVNNIVKFDTEKVTLRRTAYCDVCHNYKSVTPGYPVYLKDIDKPLPDGFYATDIHFASGNEKSPMFIVGVETHEKMRREKFKGICFSKIES